MKIIKLTKEVLQENIGELIEIDQVIKTEEHWGYENFFVELDGKWNNSYIALIEEVVSGFIICSIKSKNTLHIHRLAVAEGFRNIGIGTQLVNKIINAKNEKIKYITLKVEYKNIIAMNFYRNFGFKCIHTEKNKYAYMRLLK